MPEYEEQRRIVGLLARAAEPGAAPYAARAKARAIILALFLSMFGDPATDWTEVAIADILAAPRSTPPARSSDGFQSPHGLELLATVDWLNRESGVASDGDVMMTLAISTARR